MTDQISSGSEREPRRWFAVPPASLNDDETASQAGPTMRRESLEAVAVLGLAILGILLCKLLGAETPKAVLILGVITGLGYGSTAAAIAWVHRTSGVVSLLSLGFGALGAVLVSRASSGSTDSYWPVFVAVVIGGAVIAVGTGTLVRGRPVWTASAATLAVAVLLLYIGVAISIGAPFVIVPSPPGLGTWRVDALLLSGALLGIAGFSVLALVALVALRARPSFRLAGPLAWALLGAVLAGNGVFGATLSETRLGQNGQDIAPFVIAAVVLMRPLVAAAAGLAWGFAEQLSLWNNVEGHTYFWLGGAAFLLLAVVARGGKRPTLPAVAPLPRRAIWEALPLVLVAIGVGIGSTVDTRTDRLLLVFALTLGIGAVAQPLLAWRGGVDLSLVAIAAVNADRRPRGARPPRGLTRRDGVRCRDGARGARRLRRSGLDAAGSRSRDRLDAQRPG